jgi:hypothetical protein
MRAFFLLALFFLFKITDSHAQVANTGLMDTTSQNKIGKISLGAYIDAYYGRTFNSLKNEDVPYMSNMTDNNNIGINLAYIDVRYQSERLRARFTPGYGSYVTVNYALEPLGFKNIIEANVGLKLSKKKEIWLDFGVFGSPYTNESCVSKDHLAYTRSLAPEYVPYYLAGAKLNYVLNSKWSFYLYVLNGWQQIKDLNQGKSVATQVEFRPSDKHLINWNTYVGDESSAIRPNYTTRYFSDVYWIYNPNGKLSMTACAYLGLQKKNTLGVNSSHLWWTANCIARYSFNKTASITGRVEYFSDPDQIMVTNAYSPALPFQCWSTSLGYNLKLWDQALFRIEARQFFSDANIFKTETGGSQSNTWITTNLTAWF